MEIRLHHFCSFHSFNYNPNDGNGSMSHSHYKELFVGMMTKRTKRLPIKDTGKITPIATISAISSPWLKIGASSSKV